MAVGYARTKVEVDQRAGQLSINLRNLFTEIKRFGELLSLATDQYFLDMGYTQADVTLLKNAYTDLYRLARVYEGAQTQGTAYDFRTHSQHLMGVM